MSGAVLSVLATAAGATGVADAAAAGDGPLTIHDVAMAVLGVAMALAIVRLLRGPTLADRVVALDLLAFFAAGVVAIAAIISDRAELVMVAVVVALLTFMGTAAFALYLERKGREDAD
jgi:multicomponent Na+:H+ antiporter subunit F